MKTSDELVMTWAASDLLRAAAALAAGDDDTAVRAVQQAIDAAGGPVAALLVAAALIDPRAVRDRMAQADLDRLEPISPEARRAHALYARGIRTYRVRLGEAEYQRIQKRHQRARRRRPA